VKGNSYLFAVLAVALWGTTFAISKFVTPNPLSPLCFTAIRTFLGGLALIIYIISKGEFRVFKDMIKRHITTFLGLGAGLYSLAYVFQYWGLMYTSSINQSILSNTQTFWVVVVNLLIFKHRPKMLFLIGALISFVGVFYIIFQDGLSTMSATLLGDIISLIAFLFWGSYTAMTKPISMKENPLHVTTAIICFATIFLIPISLIFGGWGELIQISLSQWGIMFYLGVGCVGISFLSWTFALSNKNVQSENIAIISMLNPVVGIITSILLLGEILTSSTAFGCIIVFCGLFIANYWSARVEKASIQK
jgi:drug/metabolite transporter (DMT)-like permease